MKRKIQRLLFIQNTFIFLIGIAVYCIILIYFNFIFDFSEEKYFSLSEELKNYLKRYDEKIEIYAYYPEEDVGTRFFKEFLKYIRNLNRKHFKLRFIDKQELQVLFENRSGIITTNSCIFIKNNRIKVVSTSERKEFLKELYLFCQDKELKIGIISGHQELSISTPENQKYSISIIGNILTNSGFQVKEIKVKEITKTNYFLIMILSPLKDYTKKEIEILKNYWKNGGNLFIAIDPYLKLKRDTKIPEFIKTVWNIDFPRGVLIESNLQKNLAGKSLLIIDCDNILHPYFKSHLPEDCIVEFCGAGIFRLNKKSQGSPLIKCNLDTWFETNLPLIFKGKVNKDKDDILNSLYPAIVIDNKKGKCILFSDSDWLTNTNIYKKGNYFLFTNAIRYFYPSIKFIDNLPGTYRIKPLLLTKKSIDSLFIFVTSVIFLLVVILIINILRTRG